ncbi:sugar transferase [Tropicibacter sp. R15_0]|uniref:sugar transferase n=1 Tax=Tropicibacter sp. R15_0 TaxID=2821101 RepID=UPI001ADB21C1|nr:sugar transferase [Tropicibacter sp. R15_0]MBO9468086.1 sugar transferase [Tropicibacter sp. R15_0]
MFDIDIQNSESLHVTTRHSSQISGQISGQNSGQTWFFNLSKRAFDLFVSFFALLPFALISALVLLVLNPFWNRGPLIYKQQRMGRDCKPFTAYKFRSMRPEGTIKRAANDPLETDRITPLGAFLRKSRIDELPQIFNVLKGDMSLIGPRPDYIEHAKNYLTSVPGYQKRHAVRPGISGLAQVELGYIEGIEGTRRKVYADLHYIANRSFAMETFILWRTLDVVLRRGGA